MLRVDVLSTLLVVLARLSAAAITGFHIDDETCSGLVYDNAGNAQLAKCAKFFGSLASESAVLAGANLSGLPQGRLKLTVDAGTGWVCPQPTCTPPYCGCLNISYGGRNVSVAEHVVDLADEVVLMDYTVKASDVYQGAVSYLDYADSIGPNDDGGQRRARAVRVGVAIAGSGTTPAVWQTRSEAELLALLRGARPLLARHPSFGGFAVFDGGAWRSNSPAPGRPEWPKGTGSWYLDHDVVTSAAGNFSARAAWLDWAAARGVSEVYIAPHAGNNALIEIPGVEGSPAVEELFCDFIWLAHRRGIDVQLLSTPSTDARFVRSCSSRHAGRGARPEADGRPPAVVEAAANYLSV